jgi:hypothetical protein
LTDDNFKSKNMEQKNKTVPESFKQKFREFLCKWLGCIEYGPYYGMPQASCARCGHKNWCGSEHVPEWQPPDDVY